MWSLLSIPQELRDIILELVIASPADAPDISSPDHILNDRIELESDEALQAWTKGKLILSKSSGPQHRHHIFLVNHQLQSEASSVLQRTKNNYNLDVILLQERYLVPTWLLVPKSGLQVDTFTCTLRIAGSAEPEESTGYSGFRGGDGAGPAMSWVFYSLLELFILYGPSMRRCETSNGDGTYSIHNLVINVETPLGIDPNRFGPPLTSTFHRRRKDDWAATLLDPEYLADFIERDIKMLLNMEYHAAGYGEILYEHIGTITVKLDGETRFNKDLGVVLEKLAPTYSDATSSRQKRVDAFTDWKPKAMAERRRLGLSVPDSDAQN
jgi:hypothetical protein